MEEPRQKELARPCGGAFWWGLTQIHAVALCALTLVSMKKHLKNLRKSTEEICGNRRQKMQGKGLALTQLPLHRRRQELRREIHNWDHSVIRHTRRTDYAEGADHLAVHLIWRGHH